MQDDQTTPEIWHDMFTAAEALAKGPLVIVFAVIILMAVIVAAKSVR